MSSIFEPEVIAVMEHHNAGQPASSAGLSAEEIQEIDREFAHYEDKRSVALEALRIVQKSRGWISDETLQVIADHLEFPAAELESVATYFQLIFRQPVGKEVIYFCNSASCWLMGCTQLQQHIQQRMNIAPGETTADGIFTLLETPCLGDCDKAPVMMVGEEMHRHLCEESIDELIAHKKRCHANEK
jgi:NADH-quinone oxidoreductase subunit E